MSSYRGPLRDEPISLELYNTRYADAGAVADGLADSDTARAWLAGLGDRVQPGGTGDGPTPDELRTLRASVRDAVQAVIGGGLPTRANLRALNDHSRRAPTSRIARWHPNGAPTLGLDVGRASRADVVLSVLAADAVALLSGPDRSELRACGAPGCVLVYLRSSTRREWCCSACGNRARQARYYARTRQA